MNELLLNARHETQPPLHILLHSAAEDGNSVLIMFESSTAPRTGVGKVTAGDKNHALIHVEFMNVFSHAHYRVSFQKTSDFFVFFSIALNV